MKTIVCPCGNPENHEDCCGRFLSGTSIPQTPEDLMRSRYSAFCRGDIEYLISTLYPSKRSPDDRETLARTIRETQWLGLKIITTGTEEADENMGVVEFAAFYKSTETGQLHERSRFIRESGLWYYLDGQILDPVKIGRNEPCWCNSGKKFKKCHGRS